MEQSIPSDDVPLIIFWVAIKFESAMTSEPPEMKMPSLPVLILIVFRRMTITRGPLVAGFVTDMETPCMPDMSRPSIRPVTLVNTTPSTPVEEPARMAKSWRRTLVR